MKNYSVESTNYPSTLSLYQCLSGRDLVFLPHYEEVNGWYLGAYDGNKLVGFVAGNVWTEAITATIAVLPECRGMGVGKLLVQEHIKRAKDAGGQYIIWRCHEDNKASENLVRAFGGEYISEKDNWKRYKIDL